MQVTDKGSKILSSTYATSNSSGENFISEHLFSYQISGSLTIFDGKNLKIFKPGEFRLSIRNKVAKFTKHVPSHGKYHSISVAFSQAFLRDFALEYSYSSHLTYRNEPVMLLHKIKRYQDYFKSLTPFLEPNDTVDDSIIALKIKEALLTLLKSQPDLKDILFDFSEPAKIDIADYMEQNFRFNLSMQRFAYMTGRSISSFKRDFQQVFGISPGRWLLLRRLKEAHSLIKQHGYKPSDVYIKVGFEDISHFSRSFKSHFGIPPSHVSA